jgi:hypothetical protein
MKDLLFINPTHHQGRNLTVRRGVKWSTETEANILGVGKRSIETKVMAFKDLTEDDLKFEHDHTCRTIGGLINAMLRAYSDFTSEDIVTLVYYTN